MKVYPVREDRHGTRTNYQYGCRCTRCRLANSDYMADHRGGRRREKPKMVEQVTGSQPDSLGGLGVLCWCEATVVKVPPSVVQAGRTGSCGRPQCERLAAAA